MKVKELPNKLSQAQLPSRNTAQKRILFFHDLEPLSVLRVCRCRCAGALHFCAILLPVSVYELTKRYQYPHSCSYCFYFLKRVELPTPFKESDI